MALDRVDKLCQEYDLAVTWSAYELHPEVPAEGMEPPWDPNLYAQAREYFERLAREAGLPLSSAPRRLANSRLALEASEWAREQNLAAGEAFHRGVFADYFAEGRNIGDVEVLLGRATQVGLDAGLLRRVLAERRYKNTVQFQVEAARQAGVTAVPTFVAGGARVVGAQPLARLRWLLGAAGAQVIPGRP
ncbi:MAG: DsbA family oxidoreductase [Chloroflexota bacterium]